MRTISLSLAWKEWHEHKWKLASLVATLCGITGSMMLTYVDHRTPAHEILPAVRAILVVCIVPLAMFIGLGTAAGERSRGTMPFLQALPVPMWHVALNRIVFGLATIVGAVLLTLLFVYASCIFFNVADVPNWTIMRPDSGDPFSFGIRNAFGDSAAAILCMAFSFYIWTIACGVNRKDEVSAGAVALVVMVIWTVLIAYAVLGFFDPPRGGLIAVFWKRLAVIALSTAPGGVMTMTKSFSSNETGDFLGIGLFTAAVTHTALTAWYVQRFGRITNLEVRSPQVAKRSGKEFEWLGPPRSSAFVSVAWKQLRESAPIVMAGLAGIIGIVAATQLNEWWMLDRPTMHVGEIYNAIAVVLGFVMAMVIGIGVCFYDVQPQLNTFWRSRPIQPDLWFWCKYITGLTVLLTAIYAPMFIIRALGDASGMEKFNFPDVYTLPISHAAVFAAAVAMTCLVRNAIYAAILSISFMYLGVLLAYCAWVLAALFGWATPNRRIWWEPTMVQLATGLLTSIVISTITAWLAMRNDWGRKSRY
jgi:hypothetical protein